MGTKTVNKKAYEDMQMNLEFAKNNLYDAVKDLGNGTDAGDLIINIADQVDRVQQILGRVYSDDTYNILGGLNGK